MSRSSCLATFLILVPVFASADLYWIAYEGNDFPENEGWTRELAAGGAERRLEDGTLVIDSTASTDIYDAYQHFDVRTPGPDELFVAEWRVRLSPRFDYYDVTFGIARADVPGHLEIDFGLDHLWVHTDRTRIDVDTRIWHTYSITSSDMQSWDLWIDDALVHEGQFETQSILEGFVAFGDLWIGASSCSAWDFVRFGVLPEPGSAILLSVGFLARRHAP